MMASTPLSPRLECGGRGIPLRIGRALVPIFDRAHFHEVSGLDLYGAATVCQVIELFIKHTVLVPAALDRAIEAHDGLAAQRLLHQLKGSAAGMGGMHLADLCGHLQRYGDSPPAPERTESQMIREAYADLVAALCAEHARLSGPQEWHP